MKSDRGRISFPGVWAVNVNPWEARTRSPTCSTFIGAETTPSCFGYPWILRKHEHVRERVPFLSGLKLPPPVLDILESLGSTNTFANVFHFYRDWNYPLLFWISLNPWEARTRSRTCSIFIGTETTPLLFWISLNPWEARTCSRTCSIFIGAETTPLLFWISLNP